MYKNGIRNFFSKQKTVRFCRKLRTLSEYSKWFTYIADNIAFLSILLDTSCDLEVLKFVVSCCKL